MVQSLYTITFLITAPLLEEASAYLPSSARIGIYVDNAGVFHADNIYRILFFKQLTHSLCIAVPAGSLSNVSFHNAVLPLFNHPQYIIIEKKPVVILIHEQANESIDPPAIDTLQKNAQAQGWAGLHILHFFKSLYPTQREGVVSLTVPDTAALETFFLAKPFTDISDIIERHFFVQVDNVPQIALVQKAFVKIEQDLIAKNPKLYEVYAQLIHATKKLQETKEQLEFSNRQLDSLKRYNAILKSEEQTRRILEFYHGEYEVLPLWYKRFGHIIKVVTGNRSLKSLFDDTAKKTIP